MCAFLLSVLCGAALGRLAAALGGSGSGGMLTEGRRTPGGCPGRVRTPDVIPLPQESGDALFRQSAVGFRQAAVGFL